MTPEQEKHIRAVASGHYGTPTKSDPLVTGFPRPELQALAQVVLELVYRVRPLTAKACSDLRQEKTPEEVARDLEDCLTDEEPPVTTGPLEPGKPEERIVTYWRDGAGLLHCRHGVILHGTGCVTCDRDLEAIRQGYADSPELQRIDPGFEHLDPADKGVTHEKGYGPGDGDSKIVKPLREQMIECIEERISYLTYKPWGPHTRAIVLELLAILDTDPDLEMLPVSYTTDTGQVLSLRQIVNCYRAVIQAIRRGE